MYNKEVKPLPENFMKAFDVVLKNISRNKAVFSESVVIDGEEYNIHNVFDSIDEANSFLDENTHFDKYFIENNKVYVISEAKMENSEVLAAAKKLAENGKDDKAKAFGKGLVDFYEKNKSFTPDQVSGLQNIMKNASFQLAKESKEASSGWVATYMGKKLEISKNDARNISDAKKLAVKHFDVPMSKWSQLKVDPAGGNINEQYTLENLRNMYAEVLGEEPSPTSSKMKLMKSIDLAKRKKFDESEKYASPKKGKTDDGEGLDPVGQGDSDIDNDGDSDDSDKYLANRRSAIKKSMKK